MFLSFHWRHISLMVCQIIVNSTLSLTSYSGWHERKRQALVTTPQSRIVSYVFFVSHWFVKVELFMDHVCQNMMTSSKGNILRVTGPGLFGEFTGEFPAKRPVTRSFDVFFDLRLNKRLSKPSRRRWFQTLSRSLWRQRNEIPENAFLLMIYHYCIFVQGIKTVIIFRIAIAHQLVIGTPALDLRWQETWQMIS